MKGLNLKRLSADDFVRGVRRCSCGFELVYNDEKNGWHCSKCGNFMRENI